MNNEETGKGQEQGSILGNTTCEKFKHNVCAHIQAQSQHKNTGGNTLASRVHPSSEEERASGTGRVGTHRDDLSYLSLLFSSLTH